MSTKDLCGKGDVHTSGLVVIGLLSPGRSEVVGGADKQVVSGAKKSDG